MTRRTRLVALLSILTVLLMVVGLTTYLAFQRRARPAARSWAQNVKQSVLGTNIMGVSGDGVPRSMPPSSIAPAYASTASPRFNTESYDHIAENGWKRASLEALSTFSIDVDTAAYANTRRFIREGVRPPKDAVRIEELVNYFTYDYPQPTDGAPFTVTTEVGACPWRPDHRLALVGLQGRYLTPAQIPPRNLVFLIDVSGSMQMPTKLPLVKTALLRLTEQLTERDRVAIVVYAGSTGVVLPSTSGDQKERIRAAIAGLEAGGPTNGAEGLRLAYSVAREHEIPRGVNRVVIATDGDFNVGVTSEGDLIRLIEEERQHGVALSALGFGMGNYKDSMLEKIADHGNGNYAYIDSEQEAEKALVADANGTLVTIAKDVKLQVEFNPRLVSAFRLVGYENRVLQHEDFNNDAKDAGDMGVGHSVTALYEIVPIGASIEAPTVDPLKYQDAPSLSAAAAAGELMTIKLRYKRPDASMSERTSDVVVQDRRSDDLPANLAFASSVAEYGLLLRDSAFKGEASWSRLIERARRFRGDDPRGLRSEFLQLAESAQQLVGHSQGG